MNSLSDFYLIFSRECFSLEKPTNNSSHNYILHTFLFVTWDDNCIGHLKKKTNRLPIIVAASSATFCWGLIT